MPVLCFFCDVTLYGEKTRISSSFTPHSYVSYPEKIGELMGEEFVIIVTPSDYMCMKCTSLFIHMDKLENDLKLVKNTFLTITQKGYGMLPADQPEHSSSASGSNAATRMRQDPSNIQIYQCHSCRFRSKDFGDLRYHIIRCHTKKKDNEKSKKTVTKTVIQE
ncbi:uncharacterized protein LOC132947422 [Metopolophium dirhodum]|uniref:uncharacterized protein LOC132946809 n=1 Tax=Metopolophium dirhodum TaxID=44670 RepID=UPI00298F631D|nr:uncharacterized protein LOC132946809 [Metopolophium dirhodum]XP_060873682.1 uncharacterized protein LOC132947422 [Metopolophium dirhodum]